MALTLYVKGSNNRAKADKELGDCPFSQRILLVLNLKGISFNREFVDPNRKDSRKWNEFIQRTQCRRKVPILLHGDNEPIEDSDVIAEYLEEMFPEPKLESSNSDANGAGRNIYSKFAAFMRNNEPSKDETLRKSVNSELEKLNEYLGKTRQSGPFLDGDRLKLPDCNLLPKLVQVTVAGELKGFKIPDNCELVKDYLKDAFGEKAVREVFTAEVKEDIKLGWRNKMGHSTK